MRTHEDGFELALLVLFKKLRYLRMTQGLAAIILQEVLLRDVSNVLRLFVLGEQMVERLIFPGTFFLGDGLPPLLGICEFRIYIEYQAAERVESVANNFAHMKLGRSHLLSMSNHDFRHLLRVYWAFTGQLRFYRIQEPLINGYAMGVGQEPPCCLMLKGWQCGHNIKSQHILNVNASTRMP